jgi:hypothetical protein
MNEKLVAQDARRIRSGGLRIQSHLKAGLAFKPVPKNGSVLTLNSGP